VDPLDGHIMECPDVTHAIGCDDANFLPPHLNGRVLEGRPRAKVPQPEKRCRTIFDGPRTK
jgi:hypothetical protein